MKKHLQTGFTLIELVIVIVVLGILAATAIPKYFDLRAEATQATLTGLAASMTTASMTNYAKPATKGVQVQTCQQALATLDANSSLFSQITGAASDWAMVDPQGTGSSRTLPTSGTISCQLSYSPAKGITGNYSPATSSAQATFAVTGLGTAGTPSITFSVFVRATP